MKKYYRKPETEEEMLDAELMQFQENSQENIGVDPGGEGGDDLSRENSESVWDD